MLRIGLCDDEKLVIDALESIVFEIANKNNWDIEISRYYSGRELLESADILDVVFLDIDMPDMDGIETGRRILEVNPKCKIIMATGRADRFKEAFCISAFRFVTKPFEEQEIEQAIQAVLKTQIGLETIELYEKRIVNLIPQKDILYVLAYGGYTEFNVWGQNTNRVLRKEYSLSEAEQELSKDIFFRVSRQYIVNLGKITKYSHGIIHIQDKKILVSRRRKKEFEQACQSWQKEKILMVLNSILIHC